MALAINTSIHTCLPVIIMAKNIFRAFIIAGGKRVFQFDNNNPITPLFNTVATLQYERNWMKIYEANFGSIIIVKKWAMELLFQRWCNTRIGIPLKIQLTENGAISKTDPLPQILLCPPPGFNSFYKYYLEAGYKIY